MSGLDTLVTALPGFAVVIGVPLAVLWWTRRTRDDTGRRLRIAERIALGRNSWVAVVEIDGRRLLVGAGEHGVGLLTELDELAELDEEFAPAATGMVTAPTTTDDTDRRPGIGLFRRLQLMTLRTQAANPRRPRRVVDR